MSELAKALLAFQKEAPELHKSQTARVKTKTGGEYSYSYMGLDEAMQAIRPLLNKHGMILTQRIEEMEGKRVLVTEIRHPDEDVGLRALFSLPASDDMQALGSAITYARRYSLISMLGLVAEEDDDGARSQPRQPAQEPQREEGMISPKQHARLGALLGELQKRSPRAEGELTWVDDVRGYVSGRYGKHSRKQLTQGEAAAVIEEVENWLNMVEIPFGEPPPDAMTVS